MATDPLWLAVGNTVATQHRGLALAFNHPTVTLGPARPGARLKVVAHESASDAREVQDVVIGVAESRQVVLTLPGRFHRLRGRVTAASGRPVARATVMLGKDDVSRTTDDEGGFDFGAVHGQVADLRVSSPGHAFWQAAELPLQGTPVDVRVEEGVPLRVRLRDADGRRIHGASVYACDRFGITDRGDGEVSLAHLPLGPVRIQVFYDGTNHVFDHHTAMPEVTLRLELRGR
jgi:hypothetical protein